MVPACFAKLVAWHLLTLVKSQSVFHGWCQTGSDVYLHREVQSHPDSIFALKMEPNATL